MFDSAEGAEREGVPAARRALDVITFEQSIRFFAVDDCLDVIVNLYRFVVIFVVHRDRIPEIVVQGFLVVDAAEDIRFDGAEDPGSDDGSVVSGIWVHVRN
jgi:hypothetical protein